MHRATWLTDLTSPRSSMGLEAGQELSLCVRHRGSELCLDLTALLSFLGGCLHVDPQARGEELPRGPLQPGHLSRFRATVEHNGEMLVPGLDRLRERSKGREPCVVYSPQVRAQTGLDDTEEAGQRVALGDETGDPFCTV